jgi:hypothetical protein
MEKHRHVLRELSVGSNLCSCGVEVCGVLSQGGRGCNLEKGHSGPHTNTWSPEYGTWEGKCLYQSLWDCCPYIDSNKECKGNIDPRNPNLPEVPCPKVMKLLGPAGRRRVRHKLLVHS